MLPNTVSKGHGSPRVPKSNKLDDMSKFLDTATRIFDQYMEKWPLVGFRALRGDNFDDTLTVNLFKPMSVIIEGNVAVVNYVVFFEAKDKKTGEVENIAQRWIDVAVKEKGKWSWISDFGKDVGND